VGAGVPRYARRVKNAIDARRLLFISAVFAAGMFLPTPNAWAQG